MVLKIIFSLFILFITYSMLDRNTHLTYIGFFRSITFYIFTYFTTELPFLNPFDIKTFIVSILITFIYELLCTLLEKLMYDKTYSFTFFFLLFVGIEIVFAISYVYVLETLLSLVI